MALSMVDMKFDNTLGALLVGGLCATALYGVTCVQMYSYFIGRSKDTLYFKWMIASLWVLDTFDAVLNGHFLYHYMVTNYLNPTAMLKVVWSVITHVAATSVSNFIIRTMFAHRVFSLSNRNWWLTTLIMVVSSLDLAVGLAITVKAFMIQDFMELQALSNLFYLSFASGTGSDLLVALSLSFYLWRSRTGFQRTDNLIQTLMTYAINTGLLVAIDAAAGMIAYIVMPHNFVFLGFYLLLSKLYLNSYLATLNARDGLRKTMDEPVSIHLSHISGSGASRRFQEPEFTRPNVSGEKSRTETMGISVSTLVDRKVDDYTDHGAVSV